MRELMPLAERAAGLLRQRRQTVAVAESSAGGLVTAALLAVPGASDYCLGGSVVYTRAALLALRDMDVAMLKGLQPATEGYTLFKARAVRQRYGADWAIGEGGVAGPTGNRYGNPVGHVCLAVAGPRESALTTVLEAADRIEYMHRFAAAALDLFCETVAAAP